MMSPAVSPARATALRCEHLENPVGLDESEPRFSWQLRDTRIGARQTAFEIEVAAANADLPWSTGRIITDQSLLVPYAGPRLKPHTRYVWRVRIWDHNDAVTPWSARAEWTTGFLGRPWPQNARWIARPVTDSKSSTPVRYL